jgi:sulfate transport system permease protein
LIALAALSLGLLVVAPLGVVLWQAGKAGLGAWWQAVSHPDTLAALLLTLSIVLITVPLNAVFGLATAYLVARYRFPGRQALLLLADLPFSIPPILTGLFFVLLLGPHGLLGGRLPLLYTRAALVLTTLFVTLSFCLRTLLPLLQNDAWEEEEAATVLGARPATVFWQVTLPRLRFGLGNGVLLLAARALGEYGAVSVVSGRIRGLTNSLPLQVEAFYFDQDSVAAFSAASVLVLLALVAQRGKGWVERQAQEERV